MSANKRVNNIIQYLLLLLDKQEEIWYNNRMSDTANTIPLTSRAEEIDDDDLSFGCDIMMSNSAMAVGGLLFLYLGNNRVYENKPNDKDRRFHIIVLLIIRFRLSDNIVHLLSSPNQLLIFRGLSKSNLSHLLSYII